MLKSYFKIAIRNHLKNKVFSLINILGLALGLGAATLLMLYASYELSYDRFHGKAERIFRLTHTRSIDGEQQYTSATVFPEIGLELVEQFEAIEGVVRLFDVASEFKPVFSYEDENGGSVQFTESPVYIADSTFTDIFDLRFIDGTASHPLARQKLRDHFPLSGDPDFRSHQRYGKPAGLAGHGYLGDHRSV